MNLISITIATLIIDMLLWLTMIFMVDKKDPRWMQPLAFCLFVLHVIAIAIVV